MRGPTFLAGALLGGALVASCFHDPFRNKCRQAIIGIGNEVNKQLTGILHEISGKPDENTDKEQSNDG